MINSADGSRRIAIIGSGFAGLCLAIQLKKRSVDSFSIFSFLQLRQRRTDRYIS